VAVGSRVRIVKLSDSFLATLPPGEVDAVRSMIGGIFEVKAIDRDGIPWVEREVALDADEMEVIDA
jgi:hypothetical protein